MHHRSLRCRRCRRLQRRKTTIIIARTQTAAYDECSANTEIKKHRKKTKSKDNCTPFGSWFVIYLLFLFSLRDHLFLCLRRRLVLVFASVQVQVTKTLTGNRQRSIYYRKSVTLICNKCYINRCRLRVTHTAYHMDSQKFYGKHCMNIFKCIHVRLHRSARVRMRCEMSDKS